MISRLILISAVAVLFYVLLPIIVSAVRLALWNARKADLLARMASGAGGMCAFTDFTNGKIIATRIAGAHTGETVSIDPHSTRFTLLRRPAEHAHPELLPLKWKHIHSAETGERLWYAPNSGSHDADICLILDLSAHADVLACVQSSRADDRYVQAGKYWPVATGIFIEFLIFMHALYLHDLTIVTLAAIVAIFGKALPYLPPGLACTLAAQSLAHRHEGSEEHGHTDPLQAKKNRQRRAAGILLTSAGILLNLALLFLIFGYIGIPFV